METLATALSTHAEINTQVASDLERQPQCLELALERKVLAYVEREIIGRALGIASTRGVPDLIPPPFLQKLETIKHEAAAALRSIHNNNTIPTWSMTIPPSCANIVSFFKPSNGAVALRGDAAPSTTMSEDHPVQSVPEASQQVLQVDRIQEDTRVEFARPVSPAARPAGVQESLCTGGFEKLNGTKDKENRDSSQNGEEQGINSLPPTQPEEMAPLVVVGGGIVHLTPATLPPFHNSQRDSNSPKNKKEGETAVDAHTPPVVLAAVGAKRNEPDEELNLSSQMHQRSRLKRTRFAVEADLQKVSSASEDDLNILEKKVSETDSEEEKVAGAAKGATPRILGSQMYSQVPNTRSSVKYDGMVSKSI